MSRRHPLFASSTEAPDLRGDSISVSQIAIDETTCGVAMTADPDRQWRIDNAGHLKGLQLQLRRYVRWSDSWDHDHCAACWAKFAEFEGADIQHEGYATRDDYPRGACYEWVCQSCFVELKDDMGWSVAKS